MFAAITVLTVWIENRRYGRVWFRHAVVEAVSTGTLAANWWGSCLATVYLARRPWGATSAFALWELSASGFRVELELLRPHVHPAKGLRERVT